MILCSECFDRRGCTRTLAIIPQQTCEGCGRLCLGYETVVDLGQIQARTELGLRLLHEARAAIVQDIDRLTQHLAKLDELIARGQELKAEGELLDLERQEHGDGRRR